jgi:hypothetical protein
VPSQRLAFDFDDEAEESAVTIPVERRSSPAKLPLQPRSTLLGLTLGAISSALQGVALTSRWGSEALGDGRPAAATGAAASAAASAAAAAAAAAQPSGTVGAAAAPPLPPSAAAASAGSGSSARALLLFRDRWPWEASRAVPACLQLAGGEWQRALLTRTGERVAALVEAGTVSFTVASTGESGLAGTVLLRGEDGTIALVGADWAALPQ